MDSESPATTTEAPGTPRLIGDHWNVMTEHVVWKPSATVLVQHPQWPTSTLEAPIEFNENQILDAYWQAWPGREQQNCGRYGLVIVATSGLPFVEAKGRPASDTTLSVLRHVQGSIPRQLLLRLCPYLWDDMPGAFESAMGSSYVGYLCGEHPHVTGGEWFESVGVLGGEAWQLWTGASTWEDRAELVESDRFIRFPVTSKREGEEPEVRHYLFRGALLCEGVDF